MVRGEEKDVVGAESGQQRRDPRVELLERAGVAVNVVAMAVLRVEIDEVREDERGVRAGRQLGRLRHAVGVRLAPDLLVDPDAVEDVGDLADADDLPARAPHAIEDGLAGRSHGEIATVRRSGEPSLARPDERSRDDAADVVLSPHQLAGDGADPPELLDRDHVLVSGDLEDGIARGVDDRLSGAHVLLAEPVDDLGAGRGADREHLAPDPPLVLADDLLGEPVGIRPERFFDDEAHHLPVPGRGVFPGGELGHASPRAAGGELAARRGERPEKAEPLEVRQARGGVAKDVAERVGAGVAVRRGVGELSHAERVADENDGAGAVHAGSGVRMS